MSVGQLSFVLYSTLLVPLWRNRRTICPNQKAIGAMNVFFIEETPEKSTQQNTAQIEK
jgi:hypothetical protein